MCSLRTTTRHSHLATTGWHGWRVQKQDQVQNRRRMGQWIRPPTGIRGPPTGRDEVAGRGGGTVAPLHHQCKRIHGGQAGRGQEREQAMGCSTKRPPHWVIDTAAIAYAEDWEANRGGLRSLRSQPRNTLDDDAMGIWTAPPTPAHVQTHLASQVRARTEKSGRSGRRDSGVPIERVRVLAIAGGRY